MNELEILIEEQTVLRKKIGSAMKELKTWFNKKIDDVKDFFTDIKDEVKENITKVKNDIGGSRVITKDVVANDRVIFRKGLTVDNVIDKILLLMNELKDQVTNVIIKCKDGIKNIALHQHDNAVKCKDEAIKGLKYISVIASVVLGGVGAVSRSKKVDPQQLRSSKADKELKKIALKRQADDFEFNILLDKKRKRDEYENNLIAEIEAERKAKENKYDPYEDLVNRSKKLDAYIKKTNKYLYGDGKSKIDEEEQKKIDAEVEKKRKQIERQLASYRSRNKNN